MSMTFEINLPRSHTAQFPAQCILCGCSGPTSHVYLLSGTRGLLGWVSWLWTIPFVVKAPACSGCRWKFYVVDHIADVVTILTMVAVLWLVWPHVRDAIPRETRLIASLGLALTCLLPEFALRTRFPDYFRSPLSVQTDYESVDYGFTSEQYSFNFTMLNANADWVKVNDILVHKPNKM